MECGQNSGLVLGYTGNTCLNPYCNGMRIEFMNTMMSSVLNARLNPYCNGMRIECVCVIQFEDGYRVLILIVMECGQNNCAGQHYRPAYQCLNPYCNGMRIESPITSPLPPSLRCLNPYCNGMRIEWYGSCFVAHASVVLILIVMECGQNNPIYL